jgi:hypothetical protein
MNAPGSKWTRSEWYSGMRMDPRLDSVFSTRDEKVHTELKAKEAGGVCESFQKRRTGADYGPDSTMAVISTRSSLTSTSKLTTSVN